MQKHLWWGLIAVVGGVGLLFLGDEIADIGDHVDNAIQNKWTAIGFIAIGAAFLFLPSLKLKAREF